MKKLISLILFTASFSAFAGTIVEKSTTHTQGGVFRSDGKTIDVPVKECVYSVIDDPYNKANVMVFINSDEAAKTNFGFRLPRAALPLKNGTKFNGESGYTISYANGMLSARRVKTDGPLVRDVDQISIGVSSDLMHVVSAEGSSTVGNALRSINFKRISCRF